MMERKRILAHGLLLFGTLAQHATPGYFRDAVLRRRPGLAQIGTKRLPAGGHECRVAARVSTFPRPPLRGDRLLLSRQRWPRALDAIHFHGATIWSAGRARH